MIIIAVLAVAGLMALASIGVDSHDVCAAGDPCPCTEEHKLPDCDCVPDVLVSRPEEVS